MRTRTKLAILCAAFGAALATSTTALQSDRPNSAGGQAKGAPVEAAAPAAALSIPLTGATEDTAKRIESALRAIVRTAHECEGCGAIQAEKGTCAKCKRELVATTAPAVKDVRVDPVKGTMSLTLQPGEQLQLSELKRPLDADGAAVNTRVLAIPSFARLHVSAPGDPAQAQRQIRSALVDSRLFGAVKIQADEGQRLFVVTVESPSEAATYGGVVAALETASKELRLADVGWAGPCPSCVKAGRVQASCEACWPRSAAAAPQAPPSPKG